MAAAGTTGGLQAQGHLIKHTVVAQVRRTWTIQNGERSSYKYSIHSVPGYALSVLNTSLVREETNQEC